MKTLLLTCAMLLAIVGFSASDADAQFCFKWVAFCDGIQVNSITAGSIDADWWLVDCVNTTPMDFGSKGEVPISNVCPGGTGSGVIQGQANGQPWHFVIDAPLDGTLDFVSGTYPGGSCIFDELAYNLLMGPCVGVNGAGERQQARNRSTVQ